MLELKQIARAIFGIAVLSTSMGTAHATALGDLAAQLQPGQWGQLSTQGFNDNLLFWDGRHAFQYTDNLVWDPVRREVHFVGAGHLVPARHLVYTESSNSWGQRPVPSSEWISHAYDHLAIDPSSRTFFYRDYNTKDIWMYDLDAQKWTESSQMGVSNVRITAGIDWFPELQRIIYSDDYNGAMAYDPANDKWSTIKSNLAGLGPYHYYAEYSPVHKVMIFGGGNGSSAIHRLDASGNVTQMKNAPINLGITMSVITVDPVSGNFLVIAGNGTFYEYDPMADTWRVNSASVPQHLLSRAGDGEWGLVATPIATHGVVMFAKYTGGDSRVYLYKHSPGSGDPVPPPPTVSMSADPAKVPNGGTSTLSWTSTNSDSCTASGQWTGSRPTSGSEEVGPLSDGDTFTLTCNGAGGVASDSVNFSDVQTTPPEKPVVRATGTVGLRDFVFDTEGYSDVEGDPIGYSEWQITGVQNFNEPAQLELWRVVGGSTAMRLPIGVLEPAANYSVRTRHVDNTGAISEWSDVVAFTTADSLPNDNDGDGTDDNYQVDGFVDTDGNGTNDHDEGMCVLRDAESGSAIGFRTDTGTVNCYTSFNNVDLPSNGGPRLPYGAFSFSVDGLPAVQSDPAEVQVQVYFPSTIESGSGWYKYDEADGTLNDFSSNALVGLRMVTLTLVDGGNGDADGVTNGVIVDPSGLSDATGGGGGGGGGGGSSSDGGGGSASWFVGLFLLLGICRKLLKGRGNVFIH